jgi:Dolichyl-phosphate-mannose-protein mannosyltransferase
VSIAGGIIRGAMSDSVLAATNPTNGPGPFPRSYWPWLAILLTLHAGIAIWAIAQTSETPWSDYRYKELVRVALYALVMFGVAIALRGRYTRAITWSGGVLVASALLTPAVALVAGLQLLNAFVLGDRVLAYANAKDPTARTSDWAVTTLVGICLWIGVMAMVASLKVHYVAIYATALMLPLLVWWRTSGETLRRAGRALVQRGQLPSASERSWTVLLMTLVVLHLFVVAKPETGYDAMAMHLQVPMLMAETHAWPFDVTRYAWAVMPMGADWAFSAAYLMGGEGAARLLNFAFAVLTCRLLYELVRRYARSDTALASVCLFASTPIAFLETGTLYVENLWMAFLLGTLLLALDYLRDRSNATLVALALLAAGAVQCKVIGVIWLTPLLLYVAYQAWRHRGHHQFTSPQWALFLIALVLGAWPYANAWMRTGNPVFPFMNAVFRSPYYDSATSFNNVLYNAPLRPWSLYEILWSSGRFIEGSNGAAGFHWLLLLPLIALAFTRRRPRSHWLCLGLAAIFFVGVFSQHSYLRYLLPFLALFAVLGGWALSAIPDSRTTRATIFVFGALLCAVNVRFMYTASWSNLSICTACTTDSGARREYVAQNSPERVAADYLNRNLPAARVGFYAYGANPSGFVGYSRAASWHDYLTFRALTMAESADDVLANAKAFGLTHIVYRDPPGDTESEAMRAFHERYSVPIWRANGVVIAALRSAPEN